MNFQQLQDEVTGRGFDFQSSARVGSWVNNAYTELCDLEDWPFLQASASGPAPLTIADLGVVEGVRTQAGVRLMAIDRRQLEHDVTDLTTAGSPSCYYLTAGQTISTYPTSMASITVRYWKTPAEMVSTLAVPIIPARFHELIVLGALRRAALEESDGPDYASFDAEWQRGVQIMRERVLLWHRDGNTSQVRSASHGDT